MRYLLVIALIVLAGGGYWYATRDDGGQSQAVAGGNNARNIALVVAEPVERRKVVDTIEAIGTARANESVTLTAKVTDIVSRVNFEDGDYVEKGKILIVQSSEEQSALLAEARANLDDAKTQLRRLLDLGKKNLVPDSEIDAAKAQADAAKARLDSIEARMEDRLVRAPYSGILGFRQVSPGTLLTNSTPITTLDDISVIKLDFSVPEIYLNVLKPGFRVIAKSEAFKDQTFEGQIRTIGSRIDPVTRAVTVRAIIPNDKHLLRPGMLLTVEIVTDERMSMVVSETAVTQIGDETYVMLAGADGKAHKQLVQVGTRRYDFVEIVKGLKDGDIVITEGAFKLRDGAPYRLDKQQPVPGPGEKQQTS